VIGGFNKWKTMPDPEPQAPPLGDESDILMTSDIDTPSVDEYNYEEERELGEDDAFHITS
jgi:hypothetical protein